MLHVGARYYDPQVGRFISRDAVLSEHPYLYCEHEPVNAVDPSGDVPKRLEDWCKKAADWIRDHGRAVAKGVTITMGTITGINLAVEIYIVNKDLETSQRMRDMVDEFLKKRDLSKVRLELFDPPLKSHIRDAMRDIGQAAGDVAREIYKARPAR